MSKSEGHYITRSRSRAPSPYSPSKAGSKRNTTGLSLASHGRVKRQETKQKNEQKPKEHWITSLRNELYDTQSRLAIASRRNERLEMKLAAAQEEIKIFRSSCECSFGPANQNAYTSSGTPPDVFKSTEDRMTEKEAIGSAKALNASIDDFASQLIEKLEELQPIQPEGPPRPRISAAAFQGGRLMSMHMASFQAISMANTNTRADREALVDLIIHDDIVFDLHQLVFHGDVLPSKFYNAFNMAYSRLLDKELWSVCQRWRSLTASAVSEPFPDKIKDYIVRHIAERVENSLRLFAIFYHLQDDAVATIRRALETGLEPIYHAAQKLALRLRCDIISARINVDCSPNETFDSTTMDARLPSDVDASSFQGGLCTRYHVGLTSTTEQAPHPRWLLKPTVVPIDALSAKE